MTLIQKSVTINAPVDQVLAILEDPERQGELNPNLKLLAHHPSPLGYFDSKGGIDSRWEWTINAQGSTTEVSLALNYTMPGSFLGAAFNKLVIEGQNEKDIEGELAALKRLSER